MGAPSKDLWVMLLICVPIILWQISFLPAAGLLLELVVAFEALIVGSGAVLVWRYGGFAEAVTRVREVTRMWDINPPEAQPIPDSVRRISFCRYCGGKIQSDSSSCVKCGSKLR